MKDVVRVLTAVAIVAGLCSGCGKPEESKPQEAEQAKPAETNDWEPETADLSKGHDADHAHDQVDHDHDGDGKPDH